MSNIACDVITKVKINTDLKHPKFYSVILLNDNVTSALFVVQTLMEVFGYGIEAAENITQSVDELGKGIAASGLTKELASHLRDLVITRARAESFPLVAEIQEDAE